MSFRVRVVTGKGQTLSQAVREVPAGMMPKLDAIMREQTTQLRNDIVMGWPVRTGASRAAWQGPIKVSEAHYRVQNPIDYAPVIEYGGYRGVGPKTERQPAQILQGDVEINSGIFPTQRPHAPVRRALSKRQMELQIALEQLGADT